MMVVYAWTSKLVIANTDYLSNKVEKYRADTDYSFDILYVWALVYMSRSCGDYDKEAVDGIVCLLAVMQQHT
jgi:hypothetical protein